MSWHQSSIPSYDTSKTSAVAVRRGMKVETFLQDVVFYFVDLYSKWRGRKKKKIRSFVCQIIFKDSKAFIL